MPNNDDLFESCENCSGEGHYWYDSEIFYSYKSETHKYMAECEVCAGLGEVMVNDTKED